MNSDITEQYLNKLYEDLQREQMSLMTKMKNNTNEEDSKSKDLDITKQISIINNLMVASMRLRNLRKQIQVKANCS
jgi:hypothetical protein